MSGTPAAPGGVDERWLRPCAGRWRGDGTGPVLLCLPHAGGGALGYAGWEHHALAGFEPVAVRMPGREDRFDEEPVTDWTTLVARIADALGPLAHRPLALFGHSMGALTGYELAHELAGRGLPHPVLLAVSAHRPPQRMPGVARPPRGTAELLDYVRRLDDSGMTTLLDDPEWRDLVLGPLRADLFLHDSYRHRERPPLATPFTVLTGEDDPTTGPGTGPGWAALTTAGCARRRYPGGHFYLREHRGRLLADLAQDLECALSAAVARPGPAGVPATEGEPR